MIRRPVGKQNVKENGTGGNVQSGTRKTETISRGFT
jgi:hypothetical protein